ncbi:MAG: amidohydrolase family protein [Acidimicrobiaceae bacterium]|nr:amidohydrolase family protein [Acidimicrobiaceae bacterium]MCY3642381.1 amidohydrolase family protein [Acidimicrobiaceae bacterium]MDE0666931.1 amidohydrolase family protein [Acidimicrobiaceae bacterium]MXY10373.1 amidohydrolase family protein [Acidimicrobiaceae bacterium]MXZ63988.1 amidohydrolase family protein [Acidimicrobiaceae bacterium]
MPTIRNDPADPTDPEPLDFVDTHVHFWDHRVEGLHWRYLDPDFDHPRLKGMHRLDAAQYTAAELRAQAGDHAPARIVHIQSCVEAVPGLETAWLQSMADERGYPDAIVAQAHPAGADISAVIEANSGHRLLRGVRDMLSPRTIDTEAFVEGFGLLADAGLSLEVLVPYPKFDAVCALADRRPDATLILGHAGQPERRDRDYYAEWSRGIHKVATRTNIVVKISALASGADPGWSVDSIRPWALHCIEAFGSDRAMFGTNWPIDRLYGRYAALVEAYLEITSALTATERRALFSATATRVYRLDARSHA